MADEFSRLLADRVVVVLRDGEPEPTWLRGWLDGRDGSTPAYRIELVYPPWELHLRPWPAHGGETARYASERTDVLRLRSLLPLGCVKFDLLVLVQ